MRFLAFFCFATVIAACTKSDAPPVADTMAMETTPPAAESISLASVAGQWNVRVMGESSDSTLTTNVMTTTADQSGWSFKSPGRAPIPMRVISVAGDSILTESGPFESRLRKGVQVRTSVTWRMQGEKLMGSTTARYVTNGPDSVRNLRSEGTRAQ